MSAMAVPNYYRSHVSKEDQVDQAVAGRLNLTVQGVN